MKWILNILIIAVAVFGLSKLLTPHVSIVSFETAIIFSFVLAILNILVKPLIILLTLPLTIITLGLFLLVVNVLIILLALNALMQLGGSAFMICAAAGIPIADSALMKHVF